MASDELDALLESAGTGVAGATAALSAKDLNRLLAARAAGFGKTGRGERPATDNAPTAPPPPPPADEVGAAFDALEASPDGSAALAPAPVPAPIPESADPDFGPTPIHQARDRDSLPTSVMPRPDRVETLAPEEVWAEPAEDDDDEKATARLPSWSPPAEPLPPLPPPPPPLEPPRLSPPPPQFPAPRVSPSAPPATPAPWSTAPTSTAPTSTAPTSSANLQLGAARNIVDEESTGLAPMPRASRVGMILALVVGVITVIAITAFLLRGSPGDAKPSGDAAPTAGPQAPQAPGPGSSVEPSSASPAEAAARAALWRFGEGVRACALNVIGELPGTAPAIPPSFSQLKAGPYTSGPSDYRSPVYSCTNFRQSEPQAFQIQWQVFKGGNDGMAIAWLDQDGDGAADRALGLRVRFIKKGEVAIGEQIDVLEPLPVVAR